MSDIEIEIDGRKLTAKQNQTVIEVADEAGIYIPRFCYHKHLSVAANCRMCLVEVEKSPKTLPACATPVMPGMKVFTRSQKTIQAQRAVMEFLLINHPLDCPICDQGGECELQDLSMGYGASHSHYDECKRSVPDEDIGPLISTDMTRCIYCTRCVRFGAEVAGMRELGVTGRGEHSEVGTFVKHAIQSEVSGNVIDLCPVGALTSKPYRFTARAWELDQSHSVSPHDCLGTNVNVHTRYGKVMRVVTRENDAINQTWIADRDRYSYTGLYHTNAVTKPMVKVHGEWQEVDWEKALEFAASGLKEVIETSGADKFGGLAHPGSTLEEFYLLQKLVRELGSPHVDHRLREVDTRDESVAHGFPGFDMTLQDLSDSDAIFLIGSNIQKEVPLLSLRIRAAQLRGTTVLALNAVDYDFNFKVDAKEIKAPHQWVHALSDIVAGKSLMSALNGKKKISIILGMQALHHQEAALLRHLAKKLAAATGAKIGFITDSANSAGGWLAGAVPHRHAGGSLMANRGLNAYQMLSKPRDAYLLLNVDPARDFANALHVTQALTHAKFVVALSVYNNPVLEAHADVILPVAPFTETSGTFVNVLGHWQSFKGVAHTEGEARPAWKVLRVLGNFLNLDGFAYESSEDIKEELKKSLEDNRIEVDPVDLKPAAYDCSLSRIGEIPIYAVDSLVRHAEPLQEAQRAMEGDVAVVKLHPETAKQLQVQAGMRVTVRQGDGHAELPVVVDKRIAPDAVWVAGGISETAGLGDLFGALNVIPAKAGI